MGGKEAKGTKQWWLGKLKKQTAQPAPLPSEEPSFLADIDKDVHKQNVDDALRLWLSNGKVVQNIDELAREIRKIKDSDFALHLSEEKNEIAEWVRDIAKQPKLADELQKATTKKATTEMLNRFVNASKNSKKTAEEKVTMLPAAQKLLEEKRLPAPNLEEVVEPRKEEVQLDTLQEAQLALLQEEASLNREEERLNAQRIALAKKRYELIKHRGAIEKKLFERFLKQHSRKQQVQHESTATYPERNVQIAHTQEQLLALITQTQRLLQQGSVEEAKQRLQDIHTSFSTGLFTEEQRRKIQYDILEIETDVKLAMLG